MWMLTSLAKKTLTATGSRIGTLQKINTIITRDITASGFFVTA